VVNIYKITRSGWLEVITGSMYSGKTSELIRRIERVKIANQKFKVFKPKIDNRYDEDDVVSHNGQYIKAQQLDLANHILDNVYEELDVVAIDEIQFWDNEIISVIDELVRKGKRVIVCGLDQDFRGEPFQLTATLMAKAEYVDKFFGICPICGEPATKTQRIIDGEPAHWEDETILVGKEEYYEARCRSCHKVQK